MSPAYGEQAVGVMKHGLRALGYDGLEVHSQLGPSSLGPKLTVYDAKTGDVAATIEPHEAWRAFHQGGRDFLDLIHAKLQGWRERLYDYNPVADGLFEGDTL